MKPVPPLPPQRRRRQRRTVRSAAAIIAVAALALLAAACSASPASTGAGGSPNAGDSATSDSANSQLVAYSQCMRSHGVPNYPDPSGGALPKGGAQQFGVSSSQLQAAQGACEHLLPNAESFQQQVQQCEMTGDCPPAVVQQALNVMRDYAECMRSHGVPNWPDPTIDSEGRPFFNVSAAGLSYQYTHSSQLESKDAECERQIGGSAGVPVPMG
jgi:hypothetical protein